ncbi:MAG: helix-turn-helix domain-containing protein [Candidatus Omnitrophica bacterium]|nr:helix-turn-helix domain-containing protein [Candidatus Omnitrophota bacterium]
MIEYVLQQTEGNQLKAARILGLNRNTIRAKIKKLGIDATVWKV